MPTTFNFPVVQSSLDINGRDFIVTRADGSTTRPVCAFLDPAIEGNECHTVTLMGHFGGRKEEESPVAIFVEGNIKLYDNV